MRVVQIPCLRDNYAYLVCDDEGRAVVVDPSEARPVLLAAEREEVELVAIWNTHHHWDHTGGNEALLEEVPGLTVVGHESDRGRIPGQSVFAAEGDRARAGTLTARVVYNPGHTTGAITYVFDDERAAFTGDTLFLAGCGRVFEGTMEEMQGSLEKLAALPDDTRVFCGHEYTESNLGFARAVEPESAAIADRLARVREARARDQPTVPGTLAEERATNPFLRVTEPTVIAAARASADLADDSPASVFAALRRWKDTF